MKKGTIRRLDALATEGVERGAPGGPPTAFRLWKAGLNVTDHGPTVFSERSASLLLAEQAIRGNRYSIDVDHMSLDKSAPITNHAAVGWHSLEVRNGELWAVAVDWSDSVKAGLTKDPPEWKYFSPAYDVDPDTGEVVSYLNTALTNNPATHNVTALAARRAKVDAMAKAAKKATWADLKAAIEGDDENKKAEAYATIHAAFPDEEPDGDEPKKDDAADGDVDEPKKDAEPDGDEKKDAADDSDKKDSDDMPMKKDAADVPSILAAQDARLRKLEAENAAYKAKEQAEERAKLIASRVMSKELASTLANKPLSFVKDVCSALPARVSIDSKSTETVTATRGATQGSNESVDEGQFGVPDETRGWTSQKLKERMGLVQPEGAVKNTGVHQIFATMTPSQARKLATKGGK